MNNLDIYSRPVNFTYHNYFFYPSIWGGFLSLIIEGLLIAYLVYLLIDMTKREVPLVSSGISFQSFPEKITINPSPTEFSNRKSETEYNLFNCFCLFANNCVEDDILEIQVIQKESAEDKISSRLLSTEKYQPGKYKVKWASGIDPDNVCNNAYVISEPFTLEKTYGAKGAKWMEISVKYKKGADLSKFVDGRKFEIYQESNSKNTSSYEDKSIVSYMENLFWDLIQNKTKIASYPLFKSKMATNDLYLPRFLVPRKKRYYLSSEGMYEQLKTYDEQQIFTMRYTLSREMDSTERNFQDILNILALIGGLAGVSITICIIFVFIIRDFRMNESILNDCYYVVETKQDISFDEYIKSLYEELKGKDTGKIKETEMEPLDKGNIGKGLKYNPAIDEEGKDSLPDSPLTMFFNLRRIKDIYGIDQGGKIGEVKTIENKLKYSIAKIIYTAARYKSQPDFTFNCCQMFAYFFYNCCCCSAKKKLYKFKNHKKKEKNKDLMNRLNTSAQPLADKNQTVGASLDNTKIEEEKKKEPKEEKHKSDQFSETEKRFAIFYGATIKLGIDFDIIRILKKMTEFDSFIKVLLGKHQRKLFKVISKPVIRVDDYNEEIKTEVLDKDEQEYKDLLKFNKSLYRLTKKGEIKDYHIRMLGLSGVPAEEIEEFLGLIKEFHGESIPVLDEDYDKSGSTSKNQTESDRENKINNQTEEKEGNNEEEY